MIAYMPPVQNPAVGGTQHSSSAVHHSGRFVDSFDFITYTITYKISLCSTVPFSPSTLAILSRAKPSCILQVGRILNIIQFSPLGTDWGRIATKRYNKLCILRFAVLQKKGDSKVILGCPGFGKKIHFSALGVCQPRCADHPLE